MIKKPARGIALLIIFVFLRSARSTLISAVALPTSVIATFAFIQFLGFTLNMMTMLALSLSIGGTVNTLIGGESIGKYKDEPGRGTV